MKKSIEFYNKIYNIQTHIRIKLIYKSINEGIIFDNFFDIINYKIRDKE